MSTECYSMVRGSAIRVTGLKSCGSIPDPIRYAVSKSVIKVTISEVTENGSNELIRNDEDDPRLHFVKPDQTMRYTADIDFLRVDPEMFSLIAGIQLVYKDPDEGGFGIDAFGETGFGGVETGNPGGDIIGFDINTRLPMAAFALEVWSRISGQACAPGERKYGYTLFPFLKGGILSGFQFTDGAVSFSLKGAQTRRSSKWGEGPYDLTGPEERLLDPVSGNLMWRSFITTAAPPEQHDGILEITDVIDGQDAAGTSSDILDGEFVTTSSDTVEGGFAA